MPDALARHRVHAGPVRRARVAGRSVAALCVLAASCATPPAPDLSERFADAYVQLLPVGRILDESAAQDPRWPLADKAELVSAAQLRCMRAELSSITVTARQRAAAREYAETHAQTLADDVRVLEGGAARVLGEAMLAGAQGKSVNTLQTASAQEMQALTAFVTEARYAPLRRATGLDRIFAAAASPAEARQTGRRVGQDVLVRAMTTAFLSCQIPVKLLY